MNVEKIMQAVSVIEEIADALNDMPQDHRECVMASLQCRMVSLYLMTLAKHLQDGMEPYDAYLAAAAGKTNLSDIGVRDSQITLFNLLAHKSKNDTNGGAA